MTSDGVLAIDQGTTSSRAIVFTAEGRAISTAQQPFAQIYPHEGWVEHDPETIWQTSLATARSALAAAQAAGTSVRAIGIANQRETTIIWDRRTGQPIGNAIVWQDRRTAATCRALREAWHEPMVQARTGLLLDPYFSATKIAWLLDHVPGARVAAEAGELAFGTVDSWLIWRLTGGQVHATDITNASRTSLFDIHRGDWDDGLLDLFRVPRRLLPQVRACVDDYGSTDPGVLGTALPICGVAGDQQAATVGQGCFAPGSLKSTYGTGAFLLINTGALALSSRHRLLTTIAYRIGGDTAYALEGSIFVAGAAVQWLRDGLRLFADAADTQALAAQVADTGGVYLVPAFAGLGAPHWDADARGAILGLTRGSGVAEIARAALEAVAYQTADLFQAMAADGIRPAGLRVDGGMVANDWLMQFLADCLDVPVERPVVLETTALGAATLAALGCGLLSGLDDAAARWRLDRRFTPALPPADRDRRLAGWRAAVDRVLTR